MKNNQRKKIYPGILLFGVLLIGVGVLLGFRLNIMTDGYVRERVTEQGKNVASDINHILRYEAKDLEKLVSVSGGDVQTLAAMLENLSEDFGELGLQTVTGKALYGEAIPVAEFQAVRDAYHGNGGISYDEKKGLLFTVPVLKEQNVVGVLYKLYPSESIGERFQDLDNWNKEEIEILYKGMESILTVSDKHQKVMESDTVKKLTEEMAETLLTRQTAVERFSYEDETYYLFLTELENSTFLIKKLVSFEEVAGNVRNITGMVFWVFGMLFFMLCMILLYLLNAQIKVEEGKNLWLEKKASDEANLAKSVFLANMSHEIRTPINAILGFDEMMLREAKDERILEYASKVKTSGEALLALINDILDFSKIESGKMEILSAEYEPGKVLAELIAMTRTRAEEKGLKLEYDVDEKMPRKVIGDDVRIRQVILNLITNGIKYTETGTVYVTMRIQNIEEGVLTARISVRDTGIGIRKEDQTRLFEAFQRVDESRNRNIEGTGLGLSICVRILALMGSELKLSSVYGVGSEFYFDIRQKIADETPIGNFEEQYCRKTEQAKAYRESFYAPKARVMVVDDIDMNLMVFKGLLKNSGMTIVTAHNGFDAIEYAKEQEFDMIFMDHLMPQMDGVETYEKMKRDGVLEGKRTVVIILTANAVAGAREMYLEKGFADYMTKPVSGEKLEEMLMTYLPEELIEPEPEEKTESVKGIETDHKLLLSEELKEDVLDEEREVLVDWSAGRTYCMNDEEFYREMLQAFFDGKYGENLEELFEGEDWENYRIRVHALKSTSLNVGANVLSEMAKALEMALKEDNPEYVKEHHGELMVLYDKVVKQIAAYMEQAG